MAIFSVILMSKVTVGTTSTTSGLHWYSYARLDCSTYPGILFSINMTLLFRSIYLRKYFDKVRFNKWTFRWVITQKYVIIYSFKISKKYKCSFDLSRFLWQIWEDGKIKALVSGLDRKTLIRGLQTKESLTEGEVNNKIKDLVANWKDMRGTNNAWACESFQNSF
jgi:hypothetical protein